VRIIFLLELPADMWQYGGGHFAGHGSDVGRQQIE